MKVTDLKQYSVVSKGQKPQSQTQPTADSPFLQQVGTGMAKELGSTTLDVGSIGRGIQRGLSKAVDVVSGTKGFGLSGESIFDAGEKRKKLDKFFTPTTGAEKIGAFGVEAATFAIPASKVTKATKGANFLTRTGSLVASDVGVQAVEQGGFDKNSVDTAIIAAAFPVASKGAQLAKGALPSGADTGGRVINSLIKPLLKDFSYGKNPGKAVAEAGITANSLDELGQKIGVARQEVGQQISEKVAQSSTKFDATDALKPLDDALDKAKNAPATNAPIITRLENLKSDLLKYDENGVPTRNLKNLSADEYWALNREIGDLARWTGNASDDEIVNKALTTAYRNTRSNLDNGVDGVSELSSKYADLKSAEVATLYRDKIAQRQGMISFSGTQIGTASALGTAIVSGGAAIPAILAGATAGGFTEAMKSPAVKTRMAAWLASAPKEEVTQAFNDMPWLRSSLQAALFGEEESTDTTD